MAPKKAATRPFAVEALVPRPSRRPRTCSSGFVELLRLSWSSSQPLGTVASSWMFWMLNLNLRQLVTELYNDTCALHSFVCC